MIAVQIQRKDFMINVRPLQYLIWKQIVAKCLVEQSANLKGLLLPLLIKVLRKVSRISEAFINKLGGERMTKMRIYEYAKQQEIPNKKVIETLKELNIDVKNHMSTISTEEQQQLNQHFELECTSKEPTGKSKEKSNNQNQNQTSKPKQHSEDKQQKKNSQQHNAQNTGQGKKQQNHPSKKGQKKHKPVNKNKQQRKGQKNKYDHKEQTKKPTPKTPEHIVYHGTLTVSDLAEKLNKDVSEIIKKLMFLGVMANKNQDL